MNEEKECIVIIDNSNVWIEGMKLSALKEGIKSSPIEEKEPCDYSWRLSFGNLLNKVSEGKKVVSTLLVGSRPPKNDSLWTSAKKQGFQVSVFDRNTQGKEKAVDAQIIAQGTKMICTHPNKGVLILLSGDSDFIPLLEICNELGWESEIWAFKSALPCAKKMIQYVTRVNYLDSIFSDIGYRQKKK